MKRMIRITSIALLFAICTTIIFIGCAKKEEISDENSSLTSTIQVVPEDELPKGGVENPLTGLSMDKNYQKDRPIAVMINNIEQAQPLLGVSQADLMYECLVEGGITRIMAVFQNPRDIEMIGSIRSARPDFINLASGLDAIYMHIGGSEEADRMMRNGAVDEFDLGAYSDMFWRDQTRRNNLGYEHSAVTSGNKLVDGIQKEGTRTKMKSSYKYQPEFSKDSSVKNGIEAKKVTVTFSNYKTTTFTYDELKKTYLVSQFGEKQMDANQNVQNSKQNVLLLSVRSYEVDSEGHMGMDLVGGSGSGKYLNGGKAIDIRWSKKSASAPISYQTSDGKELKLMPGQMYICMVPLQMPIVVG